MNGPSLRVLWQTAMHLMRVALVTRDARADAERMLDRYFAQLDEQLRALGCAGFRGS